MKFGIDVPYEKIILFRSAVESFVKARPREWLQFLAFRANQIQSDLAYVEYSIVMQHVEGWQNIGAILTSKADLSSYCLELSKKLDMRYEAPPLPVNLGFPNSTDTSQIQVPDELGRNAPDIMKWSMMFSESLGKK